MVTIRLSYAQARALGKLDTKEPRTAAEIGETRATCDALVIAGYARRHDRGVYRDEGYIKIRELR